jgi:hypothetical protein
MKRWALIAICVPILIFTFSCASAASGSATPRLMQAISVMVHCFIGLLLLPG